MLKCKRLLSHTSKTTETPDMATALTGTTTAVIIVQYVTRWLIIRECQTTTDMLVTMDKLTVMPEEWVALKMVPQLATSATTLITTDNIIVIKEWTLGHIRDPVKVNFIKVDMVMANTQVVMGEWANVVNICDLILILVEGRELLSCAWAWVHKTSQKLLERLVLMVSLKITLTNNLMILTNNLMILTKEAQPIPFENGLERVLKDTW